jgi:hypothetical protein
MTVLGRYAARPWTQADDDELRMLVLKENAQAGLKVKE